MSFIRTILYIMLSGIDSFLGELHLRNNNRFYLGLAKRPKSDLRCTIPYTVSAIYSISGMCQAPYKALKGPGL